MTTWQPTDQQNEQFERDGYCILPNLIPHDDVMMMRGVILNHILTPEAGDQQGTDADPMDPMNAGNTPEDRAARFRKLGRLGFESPVLWHTFYANERVLDVVRWFLGDDLVLKFNSVFLKPAKTGSATPWHQDNGLWRDGETLPFNIWMAIDPATRANGCLQVVPGSHREPIFEHVLYEDSIHGEIPREEVKRAVGANGLHHIELEPGSAVCWHSNLFHYSPPNRSPQSRIAAAAVYQSAETAAANPFHQQGKWVMERGDVVRGFPPKAFDQYKHPKAHMPAFPLATLAT